MISQENEPLTRMEKGSPSVRATLPSRPFGIPAGPAPYALLACLILFPVLAWYQVSPGSSAKTVPSVLEWSRCSDEKGFGSRRHEEFLSRMNGRRITFIGDSIIRFQYLELAHYLVHGECINSLDPGDVGVVTRGHNSSTVFEEKDFSDLNDFLKASSETLNVRKDTFFSSEIMMGSRLNVHQSYTDEQRVFVYMDNWGRRIELAYSQYFDEGINRLRTTVCTADNLEPTDVVLNFGAVFEDLPRNTDCGTIWSDGSVSKSLCPFMKGICTHFSQKHPYNLYWQSTTPRLQDKSLSDPMGSGHSLNAFTACELDEGRVLDTYEMIRKLGSSDKQKAELYTGENALVPDAYHAFNWNLVRRMRHVSGTSATIKSKWTPGGSSEFDVRR